MARGAYDRCFCSQVGRKSVVASQFHFLADVALRVATDEPLVWARAVMERAVSGADGADTAGPVSEVTEQMEEMQFSGAPLVV